MQEQFNFQPDAQRGLVAEWLRSYTFDQQVAGLSPGRRAAECNPEQLLYTHVPLSPGSIIWYKPMGGGDAWQQVR